MVGLLEAVFLGLVQGLTEWLPISSFGHLIVVQKLLGMQLPLFFDVALHGGTIFALIVFFRKDIWKILSSVFRLDFKSESGRLGLLVLAGSIPVALTGFFLYNTLVALFSDISLIGAAFIATGFILYSTKFFKAGQRNWQELSFKDALFVGAAQAVSIIPGISRSGITISSALFRKIERQAAFVFSFLLAVPAIIGANAFELYKVTESASGSAFDFGGNGFGVVVMLVGVAVAAIVGYLSLKLLRDVLNKGKIYLFAYYCWAVGALVLAYLYL